MDIEFQKVGNTYLVNYAQFIRDEPHDFEPWQANLKYHGDIWSGWQTDTHIFFTDENHQYAEFGFRPLTRRSRS